jgi:hypothetical protein
MDLRNKRNFSPIHHKAIGFYNREGVCSLRGTNSVFKCNSGYFSAFKRLARIFRDCIKIYELYVFLVHFPKCPSYSSIQNYAPVFFKSSIFS